MRKIPSINQLLFFDAAARHLSFKQAAEELFVTPSAVGHQIRVLEQDLQALLFVRSNRSIALTDEGKAYHQNIANGLSILKQATQTLTESTSKQQLTIHSIPFVTKQFLAPKIQAFRAAHPGTNIRIESQVKRAELGFNRREIAIRHGKAQEPGLLYTEVLPIYATPVCAPGYLKSKVHSLIKLSADRTSWSLWQSQWGTEFQFEEVIDCDDLQSVLEMTAQGMGITMGFFPLLNELVDKQVLESPFAPMRTQLDSLYVVCSASIAQDPLIQEFTEWFGSIVPT